MEMRIAVRHHLEALDDGQDKVIYHNAVDVPPRGLRWVRPDAVVLHTTFLGMRWNDDFDRLRQEYSWLSELDVRKIALPQDEYDHSAVLEDWLLELGATHVFSCFDAPLRRVLYPRLEGRLPFVEALTGYIDGRAAKAAATRMVPPAERPFDIVYRAAKLPYWFGSHGQLKHRIAAIVDEPAQRHGLRTDISTRWEDMIFGDRWLDFVMSGRTTVGAESGSSVLDPDGAIQRRIREMLDERPELTFDEVDRAMPPGWDAYAFFAISPRHLEAVVTKTCQVLVEGSYSGVLQPERHYIPLRGDFANLDDVLERIRDVDTCAEIAERAYAEIYERGDYSVARLAADLRGVVRTGRRLIRPRLPVSVTVRRPIHPLDEPRAPGAAAEAATAARASAARGVARARLQIVVLSGIARTLRENRSLRQLLVFGLREGPRPSLRSIAGDVLRLGILMRLRTGIREGPLDWWIRPDLSDGTLVLRSETGLSDGAHLRADGQFARILWDHSAIADAVPADPRFPERGTVALGNNGRYEFKALQTLGTNHEQLLTRTFEEFEP
jgi:hypothetical protein